MVGDDEEGATARVQGFAGGQREEVGPVRPGWAPGQSEHGSSGCLSRGDPPQESGKSGPAGGLIRQL